MPDAAGNVRGIATTGKAGETIERIFGKRDYDCESCGDTGLVRTYGAEDYGISFESEACDCEAGMRELCEHEGHDFADAGGGLLICMRCRAEDWEDSGRLYD